jgi:hypothetical protein
MLRRIYGRVAESTVTTQNPLLLQSKDPMIHQHLRRFHRRLKQLERGRRLWKTISVENLLQMDTVRQTTDPSTVLLRLGLTKLHRMSVSANLNLRYPAREMVSWLCYLFPTVIDENGWSRLGQRTVSLFAATHSSAADPLKHLSFIDSTINLPSPRAFPASQLLKFQRSSVTSGRLKARTRN